MSKNREKEGNMKDKDLIRPLAFWIVLTVAYGLALYAFKNFEALSFIYHISLLVVAIYYAKSLDGLGLRVGNFRYGIALCVGFFCVSAFRSFLWGWPQFAFALDLATFSTLFFAPVTEELFWRGLVLQRMLKYPQIDVLGAVIANAGFFTLMHLPRILFFNEGAATLISILLLGVIFAIIYYLSKSVYYSTSAHIIQNIFAS